jgi:hypothetical protein
LADRDRDPPDREAWVQTNTEFHQDWMAKGDQAREVRWKSGLSLETSKQDLGRRYPVELARRRGKRWLAGLLILLVGLVIGALVLDSIGVLDVKHELKRLEKTIGRRARR